MSIEKAKESLTVAQEGLADMKEHLIKAYQSFDASCIAANRTYTGFGELMSTELQAAANNFTNATDIIVNTTHREFQAAQQHVGESGIRNIPHGNAYLATIALDSAVNEFNEFADQSDAAAAIFGAVTSLVNKAIAANEVAEEAANRPISGQDKLPELVRYVDIGMTLIANYEENV